MKLDPRHLVQLAAILDSGTLRVAAGRLGTTHPALSRTIAMMEERIGTPLFERSRLCVPNRRQGENKCPIS